MSLSIKHGVFTAPTVNGIDTVISGLSDPKAIMLWTAYQTAPGETDGDAIFSQGMGTYRGAVVQQRAQGYFDDDANITQMMAQDLASNCILRGRSALGTIDFECDLVSMDASSITLDWVDAPTAAIKVHYFIIGGDDITDALVDDFTIGANGVAQDETVVAGFGKPELLFFISNDRGADAAGQTDTTLALAVGKDETNGVEVLLKGDDGAANMAFVSYVVEDRLGSRWAALSINGVSQMDARASWPTDGFRITKPDAYSLVNRVYYLALRMSADVTVEMGRATTITSGSTVTLAGTAGTAAKGLLLFHTNVPVNEDQETGHADLAYFGIGAYDGTTEGHAGVGNEDSAVASVAFRTHSETKALQMFSPGAAGTLESEADASFSGKDAILTFSDLDTVARAFGWVLFGETVEAPASTFVPKVVFI